MKIILLLMLLLVSIPSDASEGQIKKFREVLDGTGNHRLSLFYVGLDDRGFDFHSIVWDRKEDGAWKPQITITEKQFNSNTDRKRWVGDIHSIESQSGHAIIRVAEGDAPESAYQKHYIYSWRKWDLVNNKQVEFIRECKNPLEPYSPENGIRLYEPYQQNSEGGPSDTELGEKLQSLLWNHHLESGKKCEDPGAVQIFLETPFMANGNPEKIRQHAKVVESIVIEKPKCFLSAASRLRDRKLRLLVINNLKEPYFYTQSQLRNSLTPYWEEKEFKRFKEFYLEWIK